MITTRSLPRHLSIPCFCFALILLAGMAGPGAAAEGEIVEITLHSPAIEGNPEGNAADRRVSIYLPSGYAQNTERRYPVLYLLHGSTGTNRLWTGTGYLGGYNIKRVIDDLIEAGDIRPLIVVMPDADTKSGGSWFTDSALTGHWERFVVNELVTQIDQSYRTLARKASRGIAGHSMGGYGAMQLALRHPEIYGAVYSTSGILAFEEAFFGTARRNRFIEASAAAWSPNLQTGLGDVPWELVGGVRQPIVEVWEQWARHDPMNLIAPYAAGSAKLSIAFDCGTADELIHANRVFHEALVQAGIEHDFEEFSGGHLDRTGEIVGAKILPYFSTQLASGAEGTLIEERLWAAIKLGSVAAGISVRMKRSRS